MSQSKVIFEHQNWYKGNLHTHSTISDGKKELRDVIHWYRGQGYDFLAVTDHNIFYPGESHPDFVVLSGVEMSTHTVGFGMPEMSEIPIGRDQQSEIDLINAAKGISIVAHPYWHGLTFAHVESLQGYSGMEIYNSECDYLNGRGYATVFWDYLVAQGKKVVGVAVDDTHWVRGNAGKGWICVNGDTLSTEALLAQIALGKFYASQGPEFRQIYVEDGQIMVECSPVQRINFITNAPFGKVVWADASPLEQASYALRPNLSYVRIEIVDERGKIAWSNPIWLRD